MRALLRFTLLALPLAGLLHAADSPEKRIAAILEPDLTDRAALSPDGRNLAYTLRDGDKFDLVIARVDQPSAATHLRLGRKVSVTVPSPLSASPQTFYPVVRDLRWATADRLVFLFDDTSSAASEGTVRLELRSYDVTGKKELKLANSDPYSQLAVKRNTNTVPSTQVVSSSTGTATAVVRSNFDGSANITVTGPNGTSTTTVFTPPLASTSGATPAMLGVGHLGQFDLLGFRTDDPLKAIVETRPYNTKDTTLYQMDVATGATTAVANFQAQTSESILYDQQFRPRFTRSARNDRYSAYVSPLAFYSYLGPGFDQWTSVSQLFPGRTSASSYYRNLGAPHLFPLAFDRDPNILYMTSNVGRDTFGIFAMDVRTRAFTGLGVEDAIFDQGNIGSPQMRDEDLLIFDRNHRLAGIGLRGPQPETQWLDENVARWQKRLSEKYPGQTVRIRSWTDDYKRVLAEVTNASDPGAFHVLEEGGNQPKMSVPHSSAGRVKAFSPSAVFGFTSEDGVRVTGTIVMPRDVKQPPLLLYCHEIPESDDRPAAYDPNPELQALAALGYAVAEVNYRGSSGLGLKHLAAGWPELDLLATADLHDAAAWLSAHFPVAPGRTGLIGAGFGGYLALRAAQRYPDDFRSVVSIEAPSDPVGWIASMESNHYYTFDPVFLGGRSATYTDLRATADTIRARVMLIHEPALRYMPRIPASQATDLRAALRTAGRAPEWLELTRGYADGTPAERAATFVKIGRFLDAGPGAAAAK